MFRYQLYRHACQARCLSESSVKERFKNILKYDKRKKEECKKNNIKLLYFTTEKLKSKNEFVDLRDLLNEIVI